MKAALAVVLLLACAAAHAQAIYKCKGADGRITYSNIACQGDGALLSGTPPPPSGPAAPPPPPNVPAAGQEVSGAAAARLPLPKSCDNAAALAIVVARLDNSATPDDVRPFLADERFRLIRCEYVRLTPVERNDREAAMRELGSTDPQRRRASVARVEALYDRYLTQPERTERARTRQR